MNTTEARALYDAAAIIVAGPDDYWAAEYVGQEWVCIPLPLTDHSVPDLLRAVADMWEAADRGE